MAGVQLNVKFFVMNGDGEWDCISTGQVSTIYNDQLEGMCLLFQSESDDSVILESKICLDTVYQKKQNTLIVWTDAENVSRALSFQNPESCQEFWEEICQVQGKVPTEYDLGESEKFDEILQASDTIELPSCELSSVAHLADFFNSFFVSPDHKERLAMILENGDYLKKVLQLFQVCENLHDTNALHHLHNIVKGVLFLDHTSLFEVMFSEECIMDVIGCLEYDPALAEPEKHREFIAQSAKFKEVVPITNSEIKKKIHLAYKVEYIYDVLLPAKSPIENVLSCLSDFIFYKKTEIITMLQEDETFFSEVFTQLKDKTIDDNKRHELLTFFKEFCGFSLALYPESKDTLLKTFLKLGILPILKIILRVNDFQVKRVATTIFAYIVEYNPSIIRQFIMDEDEECTDDEILINIVIEQIICDTDPELAGAMNLMAPLRSLLNPETMLITSYGFERSKFLNFFYNCCMNNLIAPLLSTTAKDKEKEDEGLGPDQNKNCPDNYQTAQLLALILELCTFCVENHTYYMKNYILSKDLLRRVLMLMQSKHTFLILCAVRLMRKIIGLRDPQYNHYIIRGNLFEPIVNAFLANGSRYNLLNSAIIELFEHINAENMKSLTVHVVRKFYKAFESIEYVQTFKNLKIKYEKYKEIHSQGKQTLVSTTHSGTIDKRVKKKKICFKLDTKEAAMPPMKNDPGDDGKLTETESTKENEHKAGLPKVTSSTVFRVSSTSAGGAGDGLSSPCSSTVTTLVDYPGDNNKKEDKEDEPPPTK